MVFNYTVKFLSFTMIVSAVLVSSNYTPYGFTDSDYNMEIEFKENRNNSKDFSHEAPPFCSITQAEHKTICSLTTTSKDENRVPMNFPEFNDEQNSNNFCELYFLKFIFIEQETEDLVYAQSCNDGNYLRSFENNGQVWGSTIYLLKIRESESPQTLYLIGLTNSFYDLPSFTRNVANTLSAAIDEDCVFKCPNGRKPKSNPYHFPEGNGCGVPGLQIPRYIPITDLEDCCKEHDICYGTCNNNKDECDKKFKKCLYKICSRFEKMISKQLLSGCKIVAKTLYTAVMAMGCKYYLNAQEEACICDINYYENEL